jgi:hypothetical protein
VIAGPIPAAFVAGMRAHCAGGRTGAAGPSLHLAGIEVKLAYSINAQELGTTWPPTACLMEPSAFISQIPT